MGTIIGGAMAVYLLAALWEWALFKRVMNDPVFGKLASVVAGWLTASAAAGFGFAHGGPFVWWATFYYIPGALIVGFIFYRQGMRALEQADDPDELAETFE